MSAWPKVTEFSEMEIMSFWIVWTCLWKNLLKDIKSIKSPKTMKYVFVMGSTKIAKKHAIAVLIIGAIQLDLGFGLVAAPLWLISKTKISASKTRYWAEFVYFLPGILDIIVDCKRSHWPMIVNEILKINSIIFQRVFIAILVIALSIWATYSDIAGWEMSVLVLL